MNIHLLNWSIDAVLCKHTKIGDIAMKSFVKINWSATVDNLDANSKLRLLNMCHDTSQIMMSDKDVAAISCQGMFSLSNHMSLLKLG